MSASKDFLQRAVWGGRRSVLFFVSLGIVAWGQPALLGPLGVLSAAFGFTLFFLTRSCGKSKKENFLSSFFWFWGVQLVQLSWLATLDFQGYYILFVYLSLTAALGLQFALFTLTIPFASSEERGYKQEPQRFSIRMVRPSLSWGRILACASLWACCEWSRLFLLCGFSWNPVGLSLCYFDLSLQWASIWGVLGLSFWVMATNLTALRVLTLKSGSRGWWGMAGLILLPYAFGYGHLEYHKAKARAWSHTIEVAVVQTSLLPSEKVPYPGRLHQFIPPLRQWEDIVKTLSFCPRMDLIVLPEAAVPFPAESQIYSFAEVRRLLAPHLGIVPALCEGVDVESKRRVSNLFLTHLISDAFGAAVVVGLDHEDGEARKNFNSAFYVRPNQSGAERYDKQVLLPLAEYLPFPFLKKWTRSYGITDFFTQGSTFKVWGENPALSACICYEETFSGLMRRAKNLGAQLFVNVTNDNYYPFSPLHRQHLFHARLRAIENGVPLVRSCNGGVSAVIDSLGHIQMQGEEKARSTRVLHCALNTYVYDTVFSKWGEAGWITLFLVFSCAYWGVWRLFIRRALKGNRLN